MQDRDHNQPPTPREDAEARSSRRKLLKAGAFVVPAMVTLHARAAFGQGPMEALNRNYDDTGYRYGEFAGKTTAEALQDQLGVPLYKESDDLYYTTPDGEPDTTEGRQYYTFRN